MKSLKLKSVAGCALLLLTSAISGAQQQARPLVCRQEALAALQPLPRLEYECRTDAANDYDEANLRWPERLRAIKSYVKVLEGLGREDWWRARVEDLDLCYFRASAGALSAEEKQRFEGGDYPISLFGNDRIRLVLTSDPCYQTGYNGTNAFLLYRKRGRVYVTQALDGYFSRADNSIGIDFASSALGQVIEIATGTGGLNPYLTNYYFVIDEKRNRAVPLKLFREGRKLTNHVTTAMIMSELKELGLPASYAAMEVIKGGRLARSFNVYEDDAEGKIDDGGRSLTRRVYRWNGRFYVRAR
ncbi:MAG TPA: hypothetical protein VF544_16185 [Pyrinomonadaceae bacterium]|jgi:hypothetical protein